MSLPFGILSDWPRSDLLSLLQSVLTLAGFVIAIWQLVRSVDASNRTANQVADLRKRFFTNDLLQALPRLHAAEDELVGLVRDGQPEAVEDFLILYARLCKEIGAMLGGRSDKESGDLKTALDSAARSASRAKATVATSVDEDLRELTKPFGRHATVVSGHVSVLTVKLQRELNE